MSIKWGSISHFQKILKREQGTIVKDWGGRLPIALAYPNAYSVAMSSLGFQSIYAMLNDLDEVVCERVVYGAPGLPPADSSIASLESQRSIEDFPIIAFSLSFEMDYLNAIDMIRLLGIPLASRERDDSHPLLIAGGPAITANPLPLSTILDAIVIGEGEQVVPQVATLLADSLADGRQSALHSIADLPGVYVPAVHGPSDTGAAMMPIERLRLDVLGGVPAHSVVLSPDTEFGDMYLIEIARGCGRNCPFCLAGHTYKPYREHAIEDILAQAEAGLRFRQRIGLISAAVSDYSRIDELAVRLREMGARVSVSSMRVRPMSEPLLQALAESGTQTLTIAPEAGSQRLRKFIQKGVRDEDLFAAAELARKYDFRQIKLYFMIGLPTETEDDVLEIARLTADLGQRFSRQITVNVTPFVPKAHTPFEREAMLGESEITTRLTLLQKELRGMGVSLKHDSPRAATIQGVLARGDQRVSATLEQLAGPSLRDWKRAVDATGLDQMAYLDRRPADANLPWGNVLITPACRSG